MFILLIIIVLSVLSNSSKKIDQLQKHFNGIFPRIKYTEGDSGIGTYNIETEKGLNRIFNNLKIDTIKESITTFEQIKQGHSFISDSGWINKDLMFQRYIIDYDSYTKKTKILTIRFFC